MTPQLEAALVAIAPLSPQERQQLIHWLMVDGETAPSVGALAARSTQFWQGRSLDSLRSAQTPSSVVALEDFVADFWPEEDEIDPFLAFLKQQRQVAN